MALFDTEAVRRALQQAVNRGQFFSPGASAGPPPESFDKSLRGAGPPPESFDKSLRGLARQIFASNKPMTGKLDIDAPLAGTARPIGVSPQVWRRFTAGKASRKEEANVRRKRRPHGRIVVGM